jgi:hypothetical protein
MLVGGENDHLYYFSVIPIEVKDLNCSLALLPQNDNI